MSFDRLPSIIHPSFAWANHVVLCSACVRKTGAAKEGEQTEDKTALAKQPVIRAKDLDGEMMFFIPRSSHPAFYDSTIEYIESTGATPVSLKEAISFAHMMEVVSHNFGMALLPKSMSRSSHLGVVFRPVADKLLQLETVLFARKDQMHRGVHDLIQTVLSRIDPTKLNYR
ncbi:MAG: transcriptional regulator [Acidobacteriaceae bacterium]|nr:transcriptional regulator [Acidobacteriaceae bacterium]